MVTYDLASNMFAWLWLMSAHGRKYSITHLKQLDYYLFNPSIRLVHGNTVVVIWNQNRAYNPQFPRMFLEHTPAINCNKTGHQENILCAGKILTKVPLLSSLQDFSEPFPDTHHDCPEAESGQSFLTSLTNTHIRVVLVIFTIHWPSGTSSDHSRQPKLPRAAVMTSV